MVQICKPAEWPLVFYFFLDEHKADMGDGMGAAKERVVYHCNVIDDEWLPFSCPVRGSSKWLPPHEGDQLGVGEGKQVLEGMVGEGMDADGVEFTKVNRNIVGSGDSRRNVLTLTPLPG